MFVLGEYEPRDVLGYFEALCAIPRGSGNERAVADYIVSVARDAGLECHRDEYNNVLVRKGAYEGREDEPSVLLQGHTDMVCEKTADSTHDFLRDPIVPEVHDGFITAHDTTLGADDGAAVAMMLALLTDKTLRSGPIECLFTVDEERGMTGAQNFDYSLIESRRVINLDSEVEGECVVSCAGGVDLTLTFENEYMQGVLPCAKITVSGLAGGHSGADIHLGRINAAEAMARFLRAEYERQPFCLISLDGGSKRNVINNECTAIITCDDFDGLHGRVHAFQRILRAQAGSPDAGVRVRSDKRGVRERTLSFRQTSRVISALLLAPTGVLHMSDEEGIPDASCNLGVVKTDEKTLSLSYLLRFNSESFRAEYTARYRALSELVGCDIAEDGYYGCWERRKNSPLAELYAETYAEMSGKSAHITGMHAGVECGFIGSSLGGDADLISIGPEMYDIHTPRERVSIRSMRDTYALVRRMLEK